MGPHEQIAQGLGSLHLPDGASIQGSRHPPFGIHLLESVRRREHGERRAIGVRGGEGAGNEVGGDKRTGTVVNEDPPMRGVGLLETGAHRLLPEGASGHHFLGGAGPADAQERRARFNVRRARRSV